MTEDASKGKRRGWRVVRRILLLVSALVAIAVGAYALWGWSLSRRHVALVDELHGMGVPAWEDLTRETVPKAANGASLLAEASRFYDEVRESTYVSDAFDASFLESWDGSDWTEEQRDGWVRVQSLLEPCFALIERAAERPTIWSEANGSPGGGGVMDGLMPALELLQYRYSHDPSSGAGSVVLLLTLASRCPERDILDPLAKLASRVRALTYLHAGVETGAFEVAPLVGRLRVLLDDWNPVAEWRRTRLGEAMYAIWLIDEYRDGRDPFEGMVDTFDEVRTLMTWDGAPDLRVGPFGPPMWLLTSWPGRPLLLQLGVGMLESFRERLREDDVPDVSRADPVRYESDRMLLLSLAYRRMARLAVEIVAYRAETGKLPTALADLPLPAEARIDPFTGEPIRFESDGAAVTITTAVPPWVELGDGPDEARATLRGKLLLWTVR